ncbi:DUF192 domain-containing protein [Prochlorococcus sp. MIT 1341]|uniref:DUF192 domain-containing protein n=1 Tax=Prochlorococcus sp. MIT 1341 TaxID=3096221 RepID=UPI002A75A84B|nr:DUF192 domain-containing protein [Prochlorococcus sp. MIT 1341]
MKQKKIYSDRIFKYVFLSLFVFLGLILKGDCHENQQIDPQYLPFEAELCTLKGECIYLELADTFEEQYIGLMKRKELLKLRGMFFLFNPPRQVKFWMYKTLFPLDMIFLSDGKVVALEHAVPVCSSLPCETYGPESVVDGVIELASGEAKRLDIRIGDSLVINAIPKFFEF